MKYNLDTYINSVTLSSVSTEDSVYPKENMYNKEQAMPWRLSANSGYTIFDFGSDRPTFFGMMNHNLLGTGAYSMTLKTAATEGALVGETPEAVVWHDQNIWHEITTTPDRWWRVDISDPDNGSNLEIGELIFYIPGTFTMNYQWPYREGLDYVIEENITHYGRRVRTRRATRKTFNIDFEGVTDANLVSEVEAFFEGFAGENPFVFIPDEDEDICWYVYALNSLNAQRRFLDDNRFTLQLEEQSRGITLL